MTFQRKAAKEFRKMRMNLKKANGTSSGGNTLPDPKWRIENYNYSLPLPPSVFLYSSVVRLISQISQSRQRTLTLTFKTDLDV